MKKTYIVLIITTLLLSLYTAYCQSVCSEFVRFRVIANSNSPYDQLVKIKLKDEILRLVCDEMIACETKDEARNILAEKSYFISRYADNFLKAINYDAKVSVAFSKHFCPKKKYEGFTMPAGEYECFEIKIGNGAGRNFFCVMFPPACVSREMTSEVCGKLNSRNIIYKFKIADILKKGD